MEKSKVIKTLITKPRHWALKDLFEDLPLFAIHELIEKSNIKIALLDEKIRTPWVQLFAQKNKREVLSLLKQAAKKEQSEVIQMPSDDEPDDNIDIDITKFCFCPSCNNMVTKQDYGEIDCPYCN